MLANITPSGVLASAGSDFTAKVTDFKNTYGPIYTILSAIMIGLVLVWLLKSVKDLALDGQGGGGGTKKIIGVFALLVVLIATFFDPSVLSPLIDVPQTIFFSIGNAFSSSK